MIVAHAHVRVKFNRVDDFRRAATENARRSVQEPGIACFDVVQQPDAPSRFVLVEVYRSPEAVAGPRRRGFSCLCVFVALHPQSISSSKYTSGTFRHLTRPTSRNPHLA